jgi:hypothetical protein
MFGRKDPPSMVVDYKNAKERDKGIAAMAKKGYVVQNVAVYPGTFKKGKAILTGGLGALTPGGLRRDERYAVTFVKQQPSQ